MQESQPETIIIADGGDITLLTSGGNPKRFLVSSTFLRNASKVWTAMFTGVSVDGHRFSAVSPKEIEMEEEDVKALEVFFRLLHVRYELLPAHVPTYLLYKVVALAETYDAINAVKLPMRSWLDHAVQETKTPQAQSHLAAAAFALGDHQAFHTLTEQLVFDYNKPLLHLLRGETNKHLAATTLLQMEAQRTEARIKLGVMVAKLEAIKPCEKCAPKIFHALAALSSNVASEPLSVAFSACAAFVENAPFECAADRNCSLVPNPESVKSKKRWPKYHEYASPKLDEQWPKWLRSASSEVRGICYFCIKAGSTEAWKCDGDHELDVVTAAEYTLSVKSTEEDDKAKEGHELGREQLVIG